MQSRSKITHDNRRAGIDLESPSEVMLRKLKLLLAQIYHPKTIPGIIMSGIYAESTLIAFYSIFIVFQGYVPVYKEIIVVRVQST